MWFWAQIEPVVPFMVSMRQAQRGALTKSRSASHSLQLIDESFMFLNYLAIGSKQHILAERFSVHGQSHHNNMEHFPLVSTWFNEDLDTTRADT